MYQRYLREEKIFGNCGFLKTAAVTEQCPQWRNCWFLGNVQSEEVSRFVIGRVFRWDNAQVPIAVVVSDSSLERKVWRQPTTHPHSSPYFAPCSIQFFLPERKIQAGYQLFDPRAASRRGGMGMPPQSLFNTLQCYFKMVFPTLKGFLWTSHILMPPSSFES
jgi:hypothetical protein